jgi:hypothetical protein
MSDSGRLWLNLLLTTTAGAISHTDHKGNTVSRIWIGNVTALSVHIYDTSSDTIKIWGTNEQDPTDTTNAIQLGSDITADGLVVIEDGPLWLFIEFDTDGGGDPYAIVTGRHRSG